MGRDPEYLAFMRAVARGLRQTGSLPVPEERRAFAAGMARLPRPPVFATEELTVPGAAGPLAARLYRADGRRPAPALVYFHGGGWYLGGVDEYDPVVRTLVAASGVSFVSVAPRLAPEYPYPAALRDAVAATGWVVAHADRLGLDPARVGVAGDSSGANLAAAVALHARDHGGPVLAAQVLAYGAYDLRAVPAWPTDPDGLDLDDGSGDAQLPRYLAGADPADRYLSPLLAPDLSGAAPAVVLAAEYDRGRPQSEAYARRLAQAAVPVTYLPGAGLDHAFLAWGPFARRPAEAVAEFGAAIRAVLTGPAAPGAGGTDLGAARR